MRTKTTYLTAAKPQRRLDIAATASVTIEAASGGEKRRPRFNIIAYTGNVMGVGGFFTPVILELSGIKPTRKNIPILLDHQPNQLIGQSDDITIDAGAVRISGFITGEDEYSQSIITHAKNGFEWQASIGAHISRQEFLKSGEKATVNGREVTGPLLIVRASRLFETSFVPAGADSDTSADVAAALLGHMKGASDMNFEKWLEAKGIDPSVIDDPTRAALKAAYDAEQHPAPAPAPAPVPVPASAPPPALRLDEIVAERRTEDHRIAEITRIAGEAINARPASVDEIERMAKAAIEGKSTINEFELAILRLRANISPSTFGGRGESKLGQRMLEAAVCITGGLPDPEKHFDERTLDAAHTRFPHGLGLKDLIMIHARENGYTGHSASDLRNVLKAAFSDGHIRAGGFSTLSLPGVLSNTATKFLRAGFMAVESGWKMIASFRSVNDFKAITSYSLTGDFTYEKVGAMGEIKHGLLGEEAFINRAETYGRMFAISRQDLINDDLDALTAVPKRLGRGAMLKMNEVFWQEFMNNGTFFTLARGNAIEGVTPGTNDSRLNIEGLTRAETAFFNMVDADGKPIGLTPKFLVVPNGLHATAFQLMNSTEVRDTTASTVAGTSNPHAGKYTIVRSSYLTNTAFTGNSATAWYLIADPNDLSVIEVVLLNGKETPTIETADVDFDKLGIQMRGYHDFGFAKQDWHAGVRAKGAA